MIGRLSGILLEKYPPQLLLDVQGVAYEVDVPMSTFYNLPQTGERVTLFTHLVVREDAHLLYGFGSENERRAFRQLLRVNGIGAKIALAVLSAGRPPLGMVVGPAVVAASLLLLLSIARHIGATAAVLMALGLAQILFMTS